MFYLVLNNEAKPIVFRPDKTRPASSLKGFKHIPREAFPSGVGTKVEIIVKGKH